MAALGAPVALLLSCPAAADVGGQVPGPGLCEYPGIGSSAMVMSAYTYYCDFPTEVNGSHWHCEYGGFAVTGLAGVSVLMFSAGISGNVGGLTGSCSWRCPDMSFSAPPNPPGGWKNAIAAQLCKPIAPDPNAEPVPAPVSDPVPLPAEPAPIVPSVTDPVFPNPVATENPGS